MRPVVCGCALDPVTLDEAVARVDRHVAAREPYEHVSINAAKLLKIQRDPMLRDAVARCELATADGKAVVWAARLLGHKLPARVAGADLMLALFELAARKRYRVFVLGARPEVLEEAIRRIRARLPELDLAGWHHGYFGDREDEVVDQIRAARPDILFIALETPAKELFIARHRDALGAFVMGVGGSIDILAGRKRRAPVWMQEAGLEWLFRLLQDPRRLAKRYVVGNTQFALLVAREKLRARSA